MSKHQQEAELAMLRESLNMSKETHVTLLHATAQSADRDTAMTLIDTLTTTILVEAVELLRSAESVDIIIHRPTTAPRYLLEAVVLF